jgi:hypothetical protein
MYDKCTHVVWSASYLCPILTNFDSVDKSHQYRISQKSNRLEPSSMRTDRRTDRTKLTVAFRNYLVNKPKMVKEWDGKL